MKNVSLKNFLFGTLMLGGIATGASGCSHKENDKDDTKQKTETEFKKQEYFTYGDFKKRMQQLTPQVMLETILSESTEFDDNGLCKPYSKKLTNGAQDKWTIGFGLTKLDGKPATKDTRHITVKEAWEESVNFYENEETYFFMWCYEIGINGLDINTQEKALSLASVMYNSNTSCIENKKDTTHTNRNQELRDLYKMYGDTVTVDQVKAVFEKHPVKEYFSFCRALDGGTTQDWANTLGNFCAEKGGIYWRRWLQGQIALGNITSQDLLDLPIGSMYEFWCLVGADKSALFNTDKNGNAVVNPDALKEFKKWAKNPVTKEGKTNKHKTVRQVLNMIDSDLVTQVEQGTFEPSLYDTYFLEFKRITHQYSCNAQNDTSYIAYKNGDYDKALESGKIALRLSETNKQKGASNYNIGVSYLAMGKYGKAVKHLEQSIAYNKTNAAQEALNTAKQKQNHRNKVAGGIILATTGLAAVMYSRKKYIMRNEKHR